MTRAHVPHRLGPSRAPRIAGARRLAVPMLSLCMLGIAFAGEDGAGPAPSGGESPAPTPSSATPDPAAEGEKRYAEALAFYNRGRPDEEPMQNWLRTCEEKFQDVIEGFPDTEAAVAALYCRSLCQSQQRRYEVAVEGLGELRAMPSDTFPIVRALLLLAECHVRMHAWEKAVAIHEEVLRDHPEDTELPEVLYALGRDLRDLGRLEEAKAVWLRLRDQHPESAAAARARDEEKSLKPPALRLAPLREQIKKLVPLLAAETAEDEVFERAEAVLAEIGTIPGKEAEEYLLEKLQTGLPRLRPMVVKPLLDVASARTTHAILRQLDKLDAELRREVLRRVQPFQLEGISPIAVLKPWIGKEADVLVRSAALGLLGRIGTRDTTKLLIEALSPYEPVTASDLRTSHASPIVRALRDVRRPEALDVLADVARDGEAPMLRRLAAADALGSSRYPAGTSALTEIVENQHAVPITLVALDSLRRRRAGDAAPAILRGLILRREDHRVRLVMVATLMALGTPLPSEPMLSLGSVDDAEFRSAWVHLVGLHVHRDECLRRLIEALSDPAWQVRDAAIHTLSQVRRIEVIDAMVARMAVEEAVLLPRLRAALKALTGDDAGLDPLAWSEHWKVARAEWVAGEEKARAGAEYARGTKRGTAAYFGLEIEGKNVAFLIDGSASMGQTVVVKQEDGTEAEVQRIVLAREELAAALERLEPDVRFNVAFFQAGLRPLWPAAHKAKKAQISEANEFARFIFPQGPTNIFDALEFVLQSKGVNTVYLLSDGAPSAGRIVEPARILDEIFVRNRTRKIVIHTIALGEDSDFLRRLAELNLGTYVSVGSTPAGASGDPPPEE